MILAIAFSLWVALGVIPYGIFLHEYKREFNYMAVFPFALFVLSTGPASLFSTILMHKGSWGFDLKPYTRAERYENFCKEYRSNYKTREQFDREY